MKLILLILTVIGVSCGERQAGKDALGKFATEEEMAAEGGHYHARYRFTHDDYESVEVAVRVEMLNGHAAKLRVKDLSPQAGDDPVEEAILRSRGCQLAFTGTSTSAEGGTYTGELELRGGIVDGCCSRMTFVPAADTSLTFVGTKLATLSVAEWQQLSGDTETGDGETGDGETGDGETGGGETGDGETGDGETGDGETGDGETGDGETGDGETGDGETGDGETGGGNEQKFYALDSTTILLSRTSLLPPRRGETKRYLMQAVIGTNDDGTYRPPVVHIKRVSTSGAIGKACLSLLFDEESTATGGSRVGRFNFNYSIGTTRVDNIWGFSDMYGNDKFSDENFFTVGVQFPGSQINYSALRAGAGTNGAVPLVPEGRVAAKRSEWGISADIVAAFGTNSGCDSQGHNRQCTGCIMQ